jgi:hypothetical protein
MQSQPLLSESTRNELLKDVDEDTHLGVQVFGDLSTWELIHAK